MVVLVAVGIIGLLIVSALVSDESRSGTATSPSSAVTQADPLRIYDPVLAGEPLPPGYRQLLPRDAIRPVYEPEFVTASEANWRDSTLVIGLELEGESRAYPVSHLNRREMVVDRVAGIPVLVTWCPLCGTAMVHRREVNGTEIVLGNQGALWGNAMTWWDHDTGSVWSQPLGEAILGPRRGETLELLASQLTTWEAWRDGHPATLALDAPGGSAGVALDDTVIVVELGSEAVAYPVDELRQAGVANDIVGGAEIAVVIDPADENRWAVFSRRLDDRTVVLEVNDGELVDDETGTSWSPVRGNAVEGPLEGEILDLLPAITAFGDDVDTFWPNARFWPPSRALGT